MLRSNLRAGISAQRQFRQSDTTACTTEKKIQTIRIFPFPRLCPFAVPLLRFVLLVKGIRHSVVLLRSSTPIYWKLCSALLLSIMRSSVLTWVLEGNQWFPIPETVLTRANRQRPSPIHVFLVSKQNSAHNVSTLIIAATVRAFFSHASTFFGWFNPLSEMNCASRTFLCPITQAVSRKLRSQVYCDIRLMRRNFKTRSVGQIYSGHENRSWTGQVLFQCVSRLENQQHCRSESAEVHRTTRQRRKPGQKQVNRHWRRTRTRREDLSF